MTQTAIPFLLFRGGTSRGPYFNRADLPEDRETLAKVLVAALGSGHPLNIDGIGGGNAVTTKVAMLSKSEDEWADVDYFFAQVAVEDRIVDFSPTCGNILSGVGPAAIEMGLVEAAGRDSEIKIRAVNSGARVKAVVQVENGRVEYEGPVAIDGVPGTAAPVSLQFMNTVGGATGALLPTGRIRNSFDQVETTCMDVAMPMVIARAESLGVSGYESPPELDENREFFSRMESLRIKAGEAMGIRDAARSVTPKFGILAPPRRGGTVSARYFMPWRTHHAMAVTGAQCLAACILTRGSVADGIAMDVPKSSPAKITLEHASGSIDVIVEFDSEGGAVDVRSAGLIRTARLLARGEVLVPASIWSPG